MKNKKTSKNRIKKSIDNQLIGKSATWEARANADYDLWFEKYSKENYLTH